MGIWTRDGRPHHNTTPTCSEREAYEERRAVEERTAEQVRVAAMATYLEWCRQACDHQPVVGETVSVAIDGTVRDGVVKSLRQMWDTRPDGPVTNGDEIGIELDGGRSVRVRRDTGNRVSGWFPLELK